MGFLTRNVGWKLLALMMAAALWIIVNREAELTTIASARLEFKNIGPGLDITGGAPERVSLRVHGPSGHITPSMLRDLAVVLDCAKVTGPGVYTFNLNGHHASLPEDVAVDSSIPSQLHLTFERDVERQVPVVPKYSHAPPPGYRVARYQLDPAVLSVGSFLGAGGNAATLNNGRLFVNLKPRGERPPVKQVIEGLRAKLRAVPGIQVFMQPVQNLRLGGRASKSR